MSTGDWHSAFLAVSALLGEPLDVAVDGAGHAGALQAAQLVGELRSPSRQVRATAIARVLAEVGHALDAERWA